MKIAVLNGSPKGEMSVTMQYVQYLMQQFPEHTYKAVPVCSRIKNLEKDTAAFDAVIDEVRSSDVVLWAFPLYVFLVHGDYKRFIELVHERDAVDAFAGKYAAAISTSIHFYDHTAHNYIRGIAEDMGMRYVSLYSAKMRDLFEEEKRRTFKHFFADVLTAAQSQRPAAQLYAPLVYDQAAYSPSAEAFAPVDTQGKRILILADDLKGHRNLQRMVTRFASFFPDAPEIIDLTDIKMLGGCRGCIKCGLENKCAYDGKDDVRGIYEEKIGGADIVVFALPMADRFFSARFKNFIDRRFFRTHQPQMTGKQAAYLISGPFSQEKNMEEILRTFTEFDGANLTEIISDESVNAANLDALLYDVAKRLVSNALAGYMPPATCRGISAQKIFRDDIWGPLRFPFRADHRYYRKHGMYDFPQKNIRARLSNAFMLAMSSLPPVRKVMEQTMAEHMVMPYQKVLKAE
jgi:multimeric flavodoxin WrbA